jgi:hypothetical protein
LRICGDVNFPTLYPASRRIFSRNVAVDPFPFVPAMWITFTDSHGFPSKL